MELSANSQGYKDQVKIDDNRGDVAMCLSSLTRDYLLTIRAASI